MLASVLSVAYLAGNSGAGLGLLGSMNLVTALGVFTAGAGGFFTGGWATGDALVEEVLLAGTSALNKNMTQERHT